jgi:hypothetical protein
MLGVLVQKRLSRGDQDQAEGVIKTLQGHGKYGVVRRRACSPSAKTGLSRRRGAREQVVCVRASSTSAGRIQKDGLFVSSDNQEAHDYPWLHSRNMQALFCIVFGCFEHKEKGRAQTSNACLQRGATYN